MGVIARIKRWLGRNNSARDLWPLRVTPSGFVCDDSTASHGIEWNDIVEICAFKIDLFSFDEVRFSLSLRNGTDIELSEQQPGFRELVAALKARFPTVEGWENRVIQPPFETNMTVLYRGT